MNTGRPGHWHRSDGASDSPPDAPEITREEFARIYKGKMADVIDFATNHIVGREQAGAVRQLIQQGRNTSGNRRARADEGTDILYTNALREESHLKSAKTTVQNSQRTRDEHMVSLQDLEREKNKLESMLEDKRRTMMLLSILEQKENIRAQRFAEIAQLLEKLKLKDATHARVAETSLPAPVLVKKPARAEHTRDTIAALQAHHVRTSRLASIAKEPSLASRKDAAEKRLLSAVARSLKSSPDSEKVLAEFQRLKAALRSQADLKMQYRSPLPEELPDQESRLQDLSLRVSEKEDELQRLADHSGALALGCAQSLQAITHFVNDTAPALRDGLQEESNRAQGHVDILRLAIVNRTERDAENSREESLSRGLSYSGTLRDIERSFDQLQRNETFLSDATSSLAPPDSAKLEDFSKLAEEYGAAEQDAEARVKKLLERKAKKAEAGHVLIEEIERLVAEVGLIANGHV